MPAMRVVCTTTMVMLSAETAAAQILDQREAREAKFPFSLGS